jgi:O-6-methylguanine DNA methyltransferase
MNRLDTQADIELADVEAVLAGLTTRAPATLAPRTLRAVGLADAWATMDSPVGQIVVAWNGLGVSWIGRPEDEFVERFGREIGRPVGRDELPARLRRAIERRLAGDRRAIVPVDLRGRTDFERDVLMKALAIPHGQVRPYGWIAAEIGRPKAVRAVGTALAHNPVPLVIPCHRVVRSDGTIGQYSLGGSDVKRRILRAEGLEPDEMEDLARAGIRFIGSDTTRIYCLPTCHHARRVTARHRIPLRSASEGRALGYRGCKVCRPDSAAVAA